LLKCRLKMEKQHNKIKFITKQVTTNKIYLCHSIYLNILTFL
jgi:hypothetical protein